MKKRTSRILAVALAAVMLLAMLAACGPSGDTPGGNTGAPSGDDGEEKESILVGRVVPLTGSIANFGAGTPFIEEAAVEAINAEGGIYIEEYGKKLPIEFVVADSESNLTKASEAATKLILEDGVDIMIASHTADTVLPVAAVCERYQVPCITVDAPLDMWLDGGPYEYCYHAFFNSQTELEGFSAAWEIIGTNKKVGLLCANDTEGTLFAEGMTEIAKHLEGYEIVDPGRFTSGTNDFTDIINTFIEQDVEIITGPVITPDFSTFWKQCKTMGYTPKISAIDKANLFLSDVIAYGDNIGNGLLSEIWWDASMETASSLTGQTSQELADMYLEYNTDIQFAPGPIGYKHANVEILVDALQRAQSLEPEKILAALDETNLDTIVGHIEYDDDNACIMTIAIGQWVVNDAGEWEQHIVSNEYLPSIPLSGTPVAIPGSED